MPSPARRRASFAAAASSFVAVVDSLAPEAWSRPGLGEWSVLDLVGHTSRALSTIENYLAAPPAPLTITSAEEYFRLGTRFTDPTAIAQRGREAGAALGPDPGTAVAELASRVRVLVAATPDDAVVSTPANGMELITYLPARTFELTVHTLDLTAATGVAVPPALSDPVADCLELAAAIAAASPDAAALLLALTGRRPLPEGFSVV